MIATLHQIFGTLVVANFFLAIIAAELYQLLRSYNTEKADESEGST